MRFTVEWILKISKAMGDREVCGKCNDAVIVDLNDCVTFYIFAWTVLLYFYLFHLLLIYLKLPLNEYCRQESIPFPLLMLFVFSFFVIMFATFNVNSYQVCLTNENLDLCIHNLLQIDEKFQIKGVSWRHPWDKQQYKTNTSE